MLWRIKPKLVINKVNKYSKFSRNGSLAPMGEKRCRASYASGQTSGDNTVNDRNTNRWKLVWQGANAWQVLPRVENIAQGGKNDQLSSFSCKFYTFATTEDDIGLPQGCEKTADTLFEKCGQWCKSLRKEVKERFWEKQEEDLARLITPEKVQEFARNQVKIIGDLIDKGQNSTSLSQIEYCDLRNFLFIQLLSQNGHRSGVLTNSTLHEYKEMSRVNETNVISVKDRKTYSQHGPANLCFDESLKGWLDIYVEHARQQVVNGIGSPCS